jgi:peroxiredoxin Q/BCP
MADLTEGSVAPDFTLETDSSQPLTLSSLKGKNVVLYFYPKSDTPGCTTEACEFRDAFPRFGKLDAQILGVSPDPVKEQAKFKAKYELPFPILADVDHEVAESYGVWVEKSMYGKKYMGVERTTFLIGKDGKIAKIFRKVKPAGHAGQVEEALDRLTKTPGRIVDSQSPQGLFTRPGGVCTSR